MNEHTPLYKHAKRPEWGFCAIVAVMEDRTAYRFDDGASRSISRRHLQLMVQVEPDEPEATEIRKRIARHAPAKSLVAEIRPGKKRVRKKPARAAAVASDADPTQ